MATKLTHVNQDGGADPFFKNDNKNHFKSSHVESFRGSQGVLKGRVHASMEKKVYNVTVSEMR